jgi:DNA topoisomerase-3
MRETVLKIIGTTGFTPDIDRVVGTVSDHHAIIPTLESLNAEIEAFPSGERGVFNLIRKRLIEAVSPKHVYEAVTVTFDCIGYIYTAKGKTVLEAGWKTENSAEESEEEDSLGLPPLSKGQSFESVTATVKEGTTKPKPHYTEDTILKAMETAGAEYRAFAEPVGFVGEGRATAHLDNSGLPSLEHSAVRSDAPNDAERKGLGAPNDTDRKGLGTPATRAGILEALIKRGYVVRVKKNLIPGDKGKNLIAVLPEALTSAKLTAQWEHKLLQIQRGELDGSEFMDGIAEFTQSIVLSNNAPKPEFADLFPEAKKPSAPELGKCPRCNSPIREGKKGFFCDKPDCGFKIWKSKFWTAKRKPLTAAIVSAMLKDGRVALKGLYSEKTGKEYNATVILDDSGDGFVNFRLEFENGGKKQ